MKIVLSIFASLILAQATAQVPSQDLARTAMHLWPDSFTLEGDKVAKWRYDQGVILKGIEGIWRATGDAKWFEYIRKSMDFYVGEDGTIKGYKPSEYNIDHINNGKLLLLLFQVTGKDKYRKAAASLRDQLRSHPRTSEGGFWHKKIYPSQMWLDGLYMGQPFYAEYASLFGEDSAFNDITRQFVLMERHSRDPQTGLLFHGWDESREQKWADPKTGRSPHIWGRALGWFGMAMVDALDHFPKNHPGKDSIIQILNRFATAVVKVQDKETGLWYDIPNLISRKPNYPEASASSMLVYALAKGVRKGYLPKTFLQPALRGYGGIAKRFLKAENGRVNLQGTVAVSGLGGKPYRDGSFEYYMTEPVIVNDPKGMGAFINAAVEIEMLGVKKEGVGKKVFLDNYFNNEKKSFYPGAKPQNWHYTWNDQSNGGFAFLGHVFNMHGATLETLSAAPTKISLSKASVYILVDPDTKTESAEAKDMQQQHIQAIASWVREGGVLVLMGNDSANNNLQTLNALSKNFGIIFNSDNVNAVKNNVFSQGDIITGVGNGIFKEGQKFFVKELSTLQLSANAKPIVKKEGKISLLYQSLEKELCSQLVIPGFTMNM